MSILHNPFLRKTGLTDFIENLSPRSRRMYAIGAIMSGVMGGMYVVMSLQEKGPQIISAADVKQSVLAPVDTRAMGLDSLSAKVNELENAINTRDHRIQALNTEIQALNRKRGNDPAVEAEINSLKSTVANLTNKAKELGWDVEEIRDTIDNPLEKPAAPKVEPIAVADAQKPSSEPPVIGPTPPGMKRVDGQGFAFAEAPAAGPAPSHAAPNPFEASSTSGTQIQPTDKPSLDPSVKAAPLVIRKVASTSSVPEDPATPDLYIPAGSVISGVLLSGLDAPTGGSSRQNPTPVVVRIQDDAILPNLYSADLKECFILLSGYGDMSSERAHLRSENLSCLTQDGKVIEQSVNGYAVGSDGKEGIRGRPVHRAGALLAKTALAGFASGIAQAFGGTPVPVIQTGNVGNNQPFQQTLTPDSLNYGAAKGASEAMNRLAKFYLEQAEQIFPILEIDAMRPVDVILTSGVSITVKKS